MCIFGGAAWVVWRGRDRSCLGPGLSVISSTVSSTVVQSYSSSTAVQFSSILPVSVSLLPRRHCVVGVLIYLNLKKLTPGRVLGLLRGGFIITCRPSLALLRGPYYYWVPAEFSSIEGTFTNQEPTLWYQILPLFRSKLPGYSRTNYTRKPANTWVSRPALCGVWKTNKPLAQQTPYMLLLLPLPLPLPLLLLLLLLLLQYLAAHCC